MIISERKRKGIAVDMTAKIFEDKGWEPPANVFGYNDQSSGIMDAKWAQGYEHIEKPDWNGKLEQKFLEVSDAKIYLTYGLTENLDRPGEIKQLVDPFQQSVVISTGINALCKIGWIFCIRHYRYGIRYYWIR